ncbi:TIGR00269 family protein [Candidatus Micrarchaeota archaeon]|nr:TIGR00269 family protein [Candidatus Micrarchaeota archaeon]MBD3417510.1 TIGR00269 family protein [Candidatus Micrarchaeota archaeon]
MKIASSSEMSLIELLHELGITAEAVLVSIDGKLIPETATIHEGQEVEIIYYKHVPPLSSPQEPRGHWKRAEYSSTCANCQSAPVIYLAYANQHLCPKHFKELFEKRVKRSIREYNMLTKGDRVGVALSGGKDSYALLHALSAVKESLPFEMVALTVDEGIPGYRDKAIQNAKKRCKELEIQQHVYTFREEHGKTIAEIAKEGKENLCSYCGVLRRKILNSKARELGMDKVAIGHNLDDVAQTAMLNLIRNEPLRFARFNEPLIENEKLIPRIRPLRDIREKEVAAYAFLHGHEYDSGCCCPHATSALRWSVRHELNSLEDQYPGTKSKIASSFNTLQAIVKDSVKDKKLKLKECSECGEPSSDEVCMGCKMLSDL